MVRSRGLPEEKEEGEDGRNQETSAKKKRKPPKPKDLAVSCMLNTEVGAVLAVIRRPPDPAVSPLQPTLDDSADSHLVQSLKSLRSFIFHPHRKEWRAADPSVYLAPFLEVVQSESVPAFATGAALSAVLKILALDVFDERTPGAGEAIHSVVVGITNCRLERTDAAFENAVLLRVLQVLSAVLRSRASVLLTDAAVCTVVNSCFQVVQQSRGRSDLLQRNARHAMHEMVQVIFSRLPEIKAPENGDDGYSESEAEEDDGAGLELGYGARCMVDTFHLLCSLMNVVEVVDAGDGSRPRIFDEDVQLFALILINSAVEFGGEAIDRHPKLLRMIQDDLFHHLIHYGTRSSPLVLSMICSTVLNLYHFLRRSLKLQLEAFFTYVLLRTAARGCPPQLQEVAIEGINSFCRQPTFVIEMYVNFDCDPVQRNVFEEIGKYLCKIAFPVAGNPLSPMQVQAFEALVAVIGTLADNSDIDPIPDRESYQVDVSEYEPFWVKRCENCDDLETWVRFVRMRKLKKKKVMIAKSHFNIDGKKGLDFLKLSHLVPSTPDPQALAYFFRYTPGLDMTGIGEFLGDPDEFNIQVLKAYTETFDFAGMILDTALRTYLETFRLPGEAQKIHRIMEAFSERFFEQQSSEIFSNKDAVFILCYSLIMLNTDQHNPQVKKKMTEEEYIRNNRSINDGKDLPREYLSELFHSISTNAIAPSGQSVSSMDMNANKWVDLIKRSIITDSYILCDFEHRLNRDILTTISGPLVATLSAIFEHTDDEEILQDCIGGLLSTARIARYGLEDILDELLTCFCKFTTLLNPYTSVEETLFTFSHDLKPRMATLAIFTIANKFGDSIRGGWRNVVDCLLKLQRLKLLPQSVIEPGDSAPNSSASELPTHAKAESGVIFPSSLPGFGSSLQTSGLMGRFSQILSLESGADSMANIGTEFENNLKIIQQCHIGNIFGGSSRLPEESLQNLVRALIFAAGGKGQRFSTPVEEEETVGFCWELLVTMTLANLHRFSTFWPQFHGHLIVVSQFPLFSPCPFAEKAIVGMFKICLRLLSTPSNPDKTCEELIFKSINLMWKLDKEILDACSESLNESTIRLLASHAGTVQTTLGWKTLLHLLSVTGRHPETYDQSMVALMTLMTEGTHITRYNYAYWIDAAFGFAALKISPLEKSTMILDLMVDSVNWVIQWHRSGFSDPGSNLSNSSTEDGSKLGSNQGNLGANLFLKLIEALRKTSLVRREEIRSHAMSSLRRCFAAAGEGLDFTPSSCIGCFNHVIFAMVDDLHEKLIEYSRRENSEREMRSMEGTLKEAMELLVEVHLQFLMTLAQSPGFRSYWLGVLRRMDTCMKAEVGVEGEVGVLQELVPELLKKMITVMKEEEVLVQREGDDLWDITNTQIQWMAPSVKEELFPEEDV